MLYNFCAAILRAQGNTKSPLIFLAIAGLTNLILNLILVIGFDLSVAGVAWATVASQLLSAILIVRHLLKLRDSCRLKIKSLRIEWSILLEIFRIGIPAGINNMVFALSNMQVQSAVNYFGSSAVAGCAASSSVEGFAYVSMNSFYQAALSFTGQNVGANKAERIPKILKICVLYVSMVGLAFGIPVSIFSHQLLEIYTTNP